MLHHMRILIEFEPKKAAAQIIAAFKQAKCHYGDAAEILQCKQHTVTRWARMLGIKEKLDEMEEQAKAEGWHHGRHGGAQYHKNPGLRVKRAKRTWKRKAAEAAG